MLLNRNMFVLFRAQTTHTACHYTASFITQQTICLYYLEHKLHTQRGTTQPRLLLNRQYVCII